ncbi:type II toxin-antitoxin system Phd/YefM family antitoxin [Mycolicibacterium senegalense]|uniref:Antitoxin n=1 Tax=Mycolicibacterium senegalense TaxID=1796 RepID=A0ABR5G1K5_9MYCO|nr:type II toxin-antitoxin system Phd/YefM family antitoxin [Mycolicibacterium senegalense]KLI05806.1 addiction module antitoxin [Mycolicibacterium senegalense]KLO54090.1 addiction module antitoxin [Mycolicibacterium senegalense]KLO54157.1 addiction module antitoxin [Mycolicibacterium senegalense]
MSTLVPISKAKAKLSELVRQAAEEDVVLINHSTPAAVLVSAERYDALLEELEDLRDRLSVHERSGITISADKLMAELGLSGE